MFQIGSVVTGSSFIGRKELLQQYKKQFLVKSRSSSVSLIGLTRIGKTSFIRKVFEDSRIPEYIIYSYSNLKESHTYQELWQSIMMPIQEYLEKHNLITEDILKDFMMLEQDNLQWIKLRSVVKRIFLYLSEKQLKTIMILDEFDYAAELFNSETQKYELFRSVISSADNNLSAILISRRNLHDIEGQTFQSSTFRGVFDTRYFKGFDETDLQEYFKVFENRKISLSDTEKQEIQYYAGNSPYLLSIIGNRIIDNKRNSKTISISEIFKNDCRQINDYYLDILKHLERDNTKNKLVSYVLGPNIGLTRVDIDELINLGYLRNQENKKIAISEAFQDYLRINKFDESIWERITTTEKKIKILLDSEKSNLKSVYKIFSNDRMTIEEEILRHTNEIEETDMQRYNSFIRSNKRDWNAVTTYFDVLSLSDSFKIIVQNWMIFSKYFGDDMVSNWESKFKLIGSARNPVAHAHEELLTDTIKRDVDNYCSDIQFLIAKNGSTPNNYRQNSNKDSINCNKMASSLSQLSNKKTGEVIQKGANYFVRYLEDEYYIYQGNSENLKSGCKIEFDLKEFSAPNSPKKMFAVNWRITDSAETTSVKMYQGYILRVDSKYHCIKIDVTKPKGIPNAYGYIPAYFSNDDMYMKNRQYKNQQWSSKAILEYYVVSDSNAPKGKSAIISKVIIP